MADPPTRAKAERLVALARTGSGQRLATSSRATSAARRGPGRSPGRAGCRPTRSASTWRRSSCRPSSTRRWSSCSGRRGGAGVPLTAPAQAGPPRPSTWPAHGAGGGRAARSPRGGGARPAGTGPPGPVHRTGRLPGHPPGGVHPNVLTGAVWPRGVTTEVRDAAVSRVQAWLGTDEQGRPNLATNDAGRHRLGQVPGWTGRCSAPCSPGPARPPRDRRAGGRRPGAGAYLVRGQFLDGRDPAGTPGSPPTDQVRGHRSGRGRRAPAVRPRLAAGDPRRHGGRPGRAAAGVQRRDPLARAAHRRVRDRPGARAARGGRRDVRPRRTGRGDAAVAPETEALIDELLPSWRTSAAWAASHSSPPPPRPPSRPLTRGPDLHWPGLFRSGSGQFAGGSGRATRAARRDRPGHADRDPARPGAVVMPSFGKNVHVKMTTGCRGMPAWPRPCSPTRTTSWPICTPNTPAGSAELDRLRQPHDAAPGQGLAVQAHVTSESFDGTISIFDMPAIPDPAVPGDLDVSACFDNAKSSTPTSDGGGPAGPVAGQRQQLPLHRSAREIPVASGKWSRTTRVYYPRAKECKP